MGKDLEMMKYYQFDETQPAIIPLTREIEDRHQAQQEWMSCLRDFFYWKLPDLMGHFAASKIINARTVDNYTTFGIMCTKDLSREFAMEFVITQMLFHFVNIPLRAIRNHSTFILEQLRPHLTPGGHPARLLEQNVATLEGLDDVNDRLDIAPYLFELDLNAQDIRDLPRPSDGSETAVEALEQGFFKSAHHNLLADTNMPSPAQMLIKRLLGLVNLAHCIPSPIKFYANFTSLVQGSGSGKSRMAKECSQRFYVVYLCLRPETSSGVPPRSLLATTLLQLVETVTSEYECNACFNRFFAAIFHVIATQVDWEAFRTDGVVSPVSFWDYTMVTHASAFAEEVLDVYNDWDAHGTRPGPTSNHMYEALKVLNPPGSTHVGPFLVVLDETRELLRACRYMPGEPSLFLQWRRWLAKSRSTWIYSFFLLLDTSSRMATTFHLPNVVDDPSAQIAREGSQLLRPIFEFPFLGPWPLPGQLRQALQNRPSAAPTRVPPSAWPPSDFQPLDHLFRFSRPRYLHVRPRDTVFTIDALMDKVIAEVTTNLLSDTVITSNLLPTVAVCYRYGLRPCPFALQDTLMSSHGATLVAISPENVLDVRYLPEPIVGEALCHWQPSCDRTTEQTLQSQQKLQVLLDCIESELHSRQLIRGGSKDDRGALATSVYLLHAYEEATRRASSGTTDSLGQAVAAEATASSDAYQTFSGLLCVQDWIATLAGAPLGVTELPNRLTRVMQSAVSFTGWTVAEEPIIPEMLQYAWCHRVGYLCNDQEPATDLVLPLVRKRFTSASVKVTRPVAAIPGKSEKRTVKTNIPVITTPPTKPGTTRMSSRASAVGSTKATMDAAGGTLGDEMDTEGALADLAQAKQQGFLPVDSAGLGAVAIQVIQNVKDIGLGDAYRYCRLQAARLEQTAGTHEDVLSVLCMTGTGRVTSRYLPHPVTPPVLLFVEMVDPVASTDESTFVGLVLNGFNEQLVGAAAKAKLEALTTHDRRQLEERCLAEYMNSTLAEHYSLIGRNLVGRLPSNYDVGAYEEPAGENDEAVAMASEPVPPLSSKAKGKPPGTATVGPTKPTMRSSGPAVAPCKVPVPSGASYQPAKKTHAAFSATSRKKATTGLGPPWAPASKVSPSKTGVPSSARTTSPSPMAVGPGSLSTPLDRIAETVAVLNALIGQTKSARLPGGDDFNVGSFAAEDDAMAAASEPVRPPTEAKGKSPAIAAVGTAASAAIIEAAPPVSPPSSVPWTHTDITVTSEGIQRHLRVYWVA